MDKLYVSFYRINKKIGDEIILISDNLEESIDLCKKIFHDHKENNLNVVAWVQEMNLNVIEIENDIRLLYYIWWNKAYCGIEVGEIVNYKKKKNREIKTIEKKDFELNNKQEFPVMKLYEKDVYLMKEITEKRMERKINI